MAALAASDIPSLVRSSSHKERRHSASLAVTRGAYRDLSGIQRQRCELARASDERFVAAAIHGAMAGYRTKHTGHARELNVLALLRGFPLQILAVNQPPPRNGTSLLIAHLPMADNQTYTPVAHGIARERR